jgi:hypothetical protein
VNEPATDRNSDAEQPQEDKAAENSNEKEPENAKDEAENGPAETGHGAEDREDSPEKTTGDKRGADEVNALRWFAQEDIEGFAEWKRVDHRDYPNQRVEVGGFFPYVRSNPPAGELEKLAEEHTRFFVDLTGLRPRLALSVEPVEDLGGGIYRVTAKVRNDGYLPTESALGARAEAFERLQMRIELPEGASLVYGVPRESIGRLLGHGGAQEHQWLVQVPSDTPAKSIQITAGSPTTGSVTANTELP